MMRTSSSCGGLDGSRRGNVVLGLLGGSRSSLSGGGSLLSRLGLLSGLLSGSRSVVLGDGLGLVLLLLLSGLSGGSLLLVVQLHGLAGLAEETSDLVALLALTFLGVGGLTLLLAEVAEERGAALVLAISSRGLSRSLLGLLGGLTLSGSSHALGLNGLGGITLDGVLQLGSSAGNRGLGSGSSSLLFSLLLRGAADLLEETAEDGSTLGLLGLLLLLLVFLLVLLLLVLLLVLGLFLGLLLGLVLGLLVLLLSSLSSRGS